MAAYEPTIGLEIHAELKTRTKMFCSSANDPFVAEANTHICPVCLAHPGTLPVINGEAIRHVLRVGIALGSKLADYTEFDRKNYYYPDLPKGYQLSQFAYPLVEGGTLGGVEITRIHLEEDTASSIHDEKTGATLIDYNRAGVPLMELVTEPVIKSAEQAGAFARELQMLLRYLGASEANMERGEMRVEANVSVGKHGVLGTKVEIKNLNSFRAMERAVAYEIKRQQEVLESGGTIKQETLGWDEAKQATFSQRTKEGSADYRYFPDPDLPSLKLSEIPAYDRQTLEQGLPELPWQRRARYTASGAKLEDAELLVSDTRYGDFYDRVTVSMSAELSTIARNYITNDLVKIVRDMEERESVILKEMPLSTDQFIELVELIASKTISSRTAKDVLAAAIERKESPKAIVASQGLSQNTDSKALESVVDSIIAQHGAVANDYRGGKAAALEFLLGQCMRQLRGAADPALLRTILIEKLSK